MEIETLYACHPQDAKDYDTATLRQRFLVESIFISQSIRLTYSHIDRLVIGGAMPLHDALILQTATEIGHPFFLARRELGVCNIGGAGTITVDGNKYALGAWDMLYIGMGARDVSFASDDVATPAKFYLVSTIAHSSLPTRLVRREDAHAIELGTAQNANLRTLRQYIIPGRVDSCQLVMGLTTMKPGGVWNTMPPHSHERRSEAYLYFDVPEDHRVLHFMGEPRETRHLVVANEQTVISPGWSIHSGCGTSAYSFIWAMGGENQDFADMDMISIGALR
jgi:4-deoxy-L-threo-5-hexosulose-uronate ketol-isomerase